MIGSAGMFSTGTNLVTQLLKQNCYIPERYEKYGGTNATKEQLGVRWQVRMYIFWFFCLEQMVAIVLLYVD